MAYGRLDVFFPDGLLKSFLLNDENISLGRSTGNTIALDTTTISRYHLSFTYKDGEVFITDLDSQNGTFVESKQLTTNEPLLLHGGEEIFIGDLRLIFHLLDENPTRPVPAFDDTVAVAAEHAGFRVVMEEPEIAISPGAHTSALLTIYNTGEASERFQVEVSGVPKAWVRVDRPELDISAGQDADVTVGLKPLRNPASAPGDYHVQVTVRPKSEPDKLVMRTVTLRVKSYSGFGVALEGSRVRAGQSFRLHMHNQGSAPLPLTLATRDIEDRLVFNLPATTFTLGPGERAVATGRVSPQRSRFFGDETEYPFDLLVTSGETSHYLVANRAYFVDRPRLPSWGRYALLGGLLAGALVLMLLALLIFTPPAPPAIETFTASAERVTQGEPLTLSWQVENAAAVVLAANGQELQRFAAGETTYTVDTQATEGDTTFELRATRGDQVVTSSVQVAVAVPFAVRYFSVTPQPIRRYTAQTLTFDWSVPGAQSVQIIGVETISASPLDPIFGATGTVNVTGILSDQPTTLTLRAQNGLGETVEESVVLDGADPTCLSSQEMNLYDAPASSAQTVSTVPSGTPIVVDGRDVGGAWLRVRIGGGLHGWGMREALTCDGFNPDDLQIDAAAPTALPPTNTPTSTPTASTAPTTNPTATPASVTLPPSQFTGTPAQTASRTPTNTLQPFALSATAIARTPRTPRTGSGAQSLPNATITPTPFVQITVPTAGG